MTWAVHVEFDTGDEPIYFPVRTYLFDTETAAREFAAHADRAEGTTNVSMCDVVPVRTGLDFAKRDLAAWVNEQRNNEDDE